VSENCLHRKSRRGTPTTLHYYTSRARAHERIENTTGMTDTSCSVTLAKYIKLLKKYRYQLNRRTAFKIPQDVSMSKKKNYIYIYTYRLQTHHSSKSRALDEGDPQLPLLMHNAIDSDQCHKLTTWATNTTEEAKLSSSSDC